jgi:DNA polymerase III epsilon subunit family exonuclease
MKALVLDTETTGLIENRVIKLDKQSEVIDFYATLIDLETGELIKEVELLIRPQRPLSDAPAPGEKKTITQITGLTNELLVNAPQFKDVASEIFALIESADLVIAHNAAFDKEILDIEAERLQHIINWPRLVCTVEQTVHLKGFRLSLGNLHELLFGERFPEAHRARTDAQALLRCVLELNKRGMI